MGFGGVVFGVLLSLSAQAGLPSEAVFKLARVLEGPAAEALLRATPEGHAIARQALGDTLHSREELPYLADALIEGQAPRETLEHLYSRLQELNLHLLPQDLSGSTLERLAAAHFSLASHSGPVSEMRFVQYPYLDTRFMNRPRWIRNLEAVRGPRTLPSVIAARGIADLRVRSPLVQRALERSPSGRALLEKLLGPGSVYRGGVSWDLALKRLAQPEMNWVAIDLQLRLRDLSALETTLKTESAIEAAIANALTLEPGLPSNWVVFQK